MEIAIMATPGTGFGLLLKPIPQKALINLIASYLN